MKGAISPRIGITHINLVLANRPPGRLVDEESLTSPKNNQQFMAQLVARIMAGEKQAEDELVETFTQSVSLVLRRNARNPTDMDDLFQDTFMIALDKIRNGKVHQPERLGGYMMNIARFTAVDFYRRQERYKPQGDQMVDGEAAENPLAEMITREKCTHLRNIIPTLKSSRDRTILQRFYIAEEDKQVICDDMGISFKNFNQIIHRAKRKLKELLLRDDHFHYSG